MSVKDIIEKRRALRSYERFEVSENVMNKLSKAAQLAPSCFNNQPWRFVFITDNAIRQELDKLLSRNNEWVKKASFYVAVFSRKQDDCINKEFGHSEFDTGLAAGFMILQAEELGLLTHPIAGFKNKEVKDLLKIPEEYTLFTLLICGKQADEINLELNSKQRAEELERPKRKNLNEFVFVNNFEFKETEE